MRQSFLTVKPLKCLPLLFFLLSVTASHSQILISAIFGDKLNSEGLEFGLEGGFNGSTISDLDASKRNYTFNLGFYFDVRLKDQWNLYTGVLVKNTFGVDELSASDLEFLGITPQAEEGTYSQRIDYFLIPALLKYNFHNRFYLEAGPQLGLKHGAMVTFRFENEEREIRIRDFNKGAINTMEAGVVFGAGYKLMPGPGMTIGIKYYAGLTNVYKDRAGTRNNAIFLKANIPIGANKTTKRSKSAQLGE